MAIKIIASWLSVFAIVKTGIGADGLMVVVSSDIADIRMRIINADGSEAEMCGNGIRCYAKYAYEHGIMTKKRLPLKRWRAS